ncbi:MAG: hypothetical protein ACTTJV_06820 [Ottowia sp.]
MKQNALPHRPALPLLPFLPRNAPFAFTSEYKILLTKQANRPQRPWMLRSALLIQEKSVDNLPFPKTF